MKKSTIKATSLRKTMRTVVFLLVIILAGGFYLAQNWLEKFAIETGYTGTDSTVESDNQTLKQLQTDLDSNKMSVDKSNGMVASSQTYQSQIVEDIKKYASTSGVIISSTNIEESAVSAATSIGVVDGLTPRYISITLGNPVQFTNLMQFIRAIESNLPKMQISNISISPVANSKTGVTVKPITIGVYTK